MARQRHGGRPGAADPTYVINVNCCILNNDSKPRQRSPRRQAAMALCMALVASLGLQTVPVKAQTTTAAAPPDTIAPPEAVAPPDTFAPPESVAPLPAFTPNPNLLVTPKPNDCPQSASVLGVSRIIEIDADSGPLFGVITKQENEPSFLGPKEVVLTFDDGPAPAITTPILETLKRHCTKATFFAVGRMARAYADTLRAVVDDGHTVGGHTWSHPLNLRKLPFARAVAEIERGFAAIEKAIGTETAPFFRFTGLNDSPQLLAYLQSRGVASFTVDVVSDDSFIRDPDELTRLTMARIRHANGGIVLFHDIKKSTAKALPDILDALHDEGFKVVHLRASRPLRPHPDYPVPQMRQDNAADLAAGIKGDEPSDAELKSRPHLKRLIPFYSAAVLERALDPAITGRPVTVLKTPPRERVKGLGTSAANRQPMPVPPSPERRDANRGQDRPDQSS